MSRVPRPSVVHFRELPSDDDIPETQAPERGSSRALPDWMYSANADVSKKEWDHLRDHGETAETREESGPLEGSSEKRVSSPIDTIAKRDLRPVPVDQIELSTEGDTSDAVARRHALALAREGDEELFFRRDVFYGASPEKSDLPSFSGAIGPVRAWHTEDQVTSARVEEDHVLERGPKSEKLITGMSYVSPTGRVPGRDPNDAAVPLQRLSSSEARSLDYGKRIKIDVEDTSFHEYGLKGTLTPLPFAGSLGMIAAFFADVGPLYGQADFRSGVRGNAFIEVERGFGSSVHVRIGVRDQGSKSDWAFEVGGGVHIDDSYFEYGAKKIKKYGAERPDAAPDGNAVQRTFRGLMERLSRSFSSGAEEELRSLEDQARSVERVVSPQIGELNRRLKLYQYRKRERDLEDSLTLYDLSFDLSQPEACRAFDRIMDSHGEYRTLDMGVLEGLTKEPTSGVKVNDNRVRAATRNSVGRIFNTLGFAWEWVEAHERGSVETAGESGRATISQEKTARKRARRRPGQSRSTVVETRIHTVEDHDRDETHTRLSLEVSRSVSGSQARTHALADLLAMTAAAGESRDAQHPLERFRASTGTAAGARLFGLWKPNRRVGEAKAEVRVKLRAEAIDALLERCESPALWRRLAEAHRLEHGLEQTPSWPAEGLNDDGLLAWIRRGLPLGRAQQAFVAARRSLEALKRTRDTDDPVEAAEHLRAAFENLKHEPALTGALLAEARAHSDESASELHQNLDGEDLLDALGLREETETVERDEKPPHTEQKEDLAESLKAPTEERDKEEDAQANEPPRPPKQRAS